LQAEHMDMLHLVPHAQVTHQATRDGRWSDRTTWKDGMLPTAHAKVLVPRGTTVIVDREFDIPLRTVRVDGKRDFAPDRDASLLVDTMVVSPAGHLVMGTVETPIAPDKCARLIFADRGPIDTRWDPNLLSRGLIAHGSASLVGADVTPFAAL